MSNNRALARIEGWESVFSYDDKYIITYRRGSYGSNILVFDLSKATVLTDLESKPFITNAPKIRTKLTPHTHVLIGEENNLRIQFDFNKFNLFYFARTNNQENWELIVNSEAVKLVDGDSEYIINSSKPQFIYENTKKLTVCTETEKFTLYLIETLLPCFEINTQPSESPTCVSYSPRCKNLFVCLSIRERKQITAGDRKYPRSEFEKALINIYDEFGCLIDTVSTTHKDDITILAFSRDGAEFCTISRDKTAFIWKMTLKGMSVIGTFSSNKSDILSVDFSRDGRNCLFGLETEFVIWDIEKERIVNKAAVNNIIIKVFYSEDNSKIICVLKNGDILICDTLSFEVTDKLYCSLDIHINGCNFNNIICDHSTKKIIHQYGGFDSTVAVN